MYRTIALAVFAGQIALLGVIKNVVMVPAAPVITSGTVATCTQGQPFSYQIRGSGNPASYGATGLPAGLVVDTATGIISGTLTAIGTSSVTVSGSNSLGTGKAILQITAFSPDAQHDPFAALVPGNNPSAGGCWRYGYTINSGGVFRLYTESGSDSAGTTISWHGLTAAPNVTRNISGADFVEADILNPGEDFLAISPGTNGQYSVARWTAKTSGTYQVAAMFKSLRIKGPAIASNIRIFHNTDSIFHGTIDSLLPLSGQTFTITVPVKEGDTIDFAVGPGANNGISNPLAPLDTVTPKSAPVATTVNVGGSIGLKARIEPLGMAIGVKTGPASGITSKTAILEGTVSFNGSDGTVYFQYGATSSYGSETEPRTISGTANVAVTGMAADLEMNTMYHYRAVAVTTSGTAYGIDQTLTTFIPAVVYDIFDDFSADANPGPAGTWRYGYFSSLGGEFTPFTMKAAEEGADFLHDWKVPQLPAVVKNTSGTAYSHPGDLNVSPVGGFVDMHPGPTGDFAVTRWTAPAAGVYQIGATFESLRVIGKPATTDIHVLKSGSSIFDGAIDSYMPWSEQIFTRTVSVKAGDTIDFAVGYGSDLSYFSDSTGVRGTITQIASGGLDGGLSVTPRAGLASAGKQAGPFSPLSRSYTLTNEEPVPIQWSASNATSWLSLSQTDGTLASGSSIVVTATIKSDANTLTSGSYSDTIKFTNASEGAGNISIPVTLMVQPK